MTAIDVYDGDVQPVTDRPIDGRLPPSRTADCHVPGVRHQRLPQHGVDDAVGGGGGGGDRRQGDGGLGTPIAVKKKPEVVEVDLDRLTGRDLDPPRRTGSTAPGDVRHEARDDAAARWRHDE